MQITRRNAIKTMGLSASAAAVAPNLLLGETFENRGLPATQPNVLFVFTDQQHNRSWEVFNSHVKTPHLKQLGADGTVFRNCVSTAPVCTPYRGMLMTGQFPRMNGVTRNDAPLNINGNTWGEVMKAQGYRTAFIGKWHLAGQRENWNTGDQFVIESKRAGFDTWKASECWHKYKTQSSSFYYDEADVKHLHPKYQPESEADQINTFLQDHHDNHGSDPFFCVWAPGPPHNPYDEYDPSQSSPDYSYYLSRVSDLKPPNFGSGTTDAELAGYYAMCTGLDNALGRVLAQLDTLGMTENTIVVYTSDHGDMLGAHSERMKMRPYEESINVPLIVRYPGVVPAGKVSTTLVGTPDFMPTIMSLAGLKDAVPSVVQGRDLSLQARGQRVRNPEAAFLCMTDQRHLNPAVLSGQRAPSEWIGIRTERFIYATFAKGVHVDGYGAREGYILHDLKKDPWQQKNLVDRPEYAGGQAALWDRLRVMAENAGELDAGFEMPDRPSAKGVAIKVG